MSSGSVSKECKTCFDWQSQSGVRNKYHWTPCLDDNGNPTCAPCDEGSSPGMRDPQECVSNLLPKYNPSQLPQCSQTCYPQCAGCTATNCTNPTTCMNSGYIENYNNYGQRIGPHTYVKLGNTWNVQKPYSL